MLKRNMQVRRHEIVQLINQHGEISVEALSTRFKTSEVTIRKDLASLEKNGVLLRRYGGAISLPKEVVTDEANSNISIQKELLAKTAASLIRDHHRIVIDSGSTTGALIQRLNEKQGLVVMTNTLYIANALHELENEPTILMTGGTWDPHSESFQGQVAESALRSYDFDQLFIGCDGIDLDRGTTTFNELMGLSRVMAEVSREVVVMAESDKIGRKIPNLELSWEQIDILVTDERLSDEYAAIIASHQVKIIQAKSV